MNASNGVPLCVWISPPDQQHLDVIADPVSEAKTTAVVAKAGSQADPKANAKAIAKVIPERLTSYSNKLKCGVGVDIVRQLMTLANCSLEDIVLVCGLEEVEPEAKIDDAHDKTRQQINEHHDNSNMIADENMKSLMNRLNDMEVDADGMSTDDDMPSLVPCDSTDDDTDDESSLSLSSSSSSSSSSL